MAEAFDTRELGAALRFDDAEFFPLNDLPNDVLVSVFIAVDDPIWVRHTVPLVCKEWNELYRSKDASPLHETLDVDFTKEVDGAEVMAAMEGRWRGDPVKGATRHPVVHASRVISWAERRAGSVRKLHLNGMGGGNFEDFGSEDMGRLVAAVGPSLDELRMVVPKQDRGDDRIESFWEAVRDSVVPAGRLRSLVVKGFFAGVDESDVAPLGQLAGSLEELELNTPYFGPSRCPLRRFPEVLCDLAELQRLCLVGHELITWIPAGISSLKKLKELEIYNCTLRSLPKELGELSGLTRLDLSGNWTRGNTPQDEAFPAELGKLKSLRYLKLKDCGLGAVPAFVGELKSLEVLDLSNNDLTFENAPLDFLIDACPRLRVVELCRYSFRPPWTSESLAHLEAFKAKLLERNPEAKVSWTVPRW